MTSIILCNQQKYGEIKFNLEKDYEDIIKSNSKLIFGPSTIFIDTKKKINTAFIGGSIPDALLFDLSDMENPEFYIVEVELAKHEFYKHIFPQVTKFFAFYRNSKSQNDLIEKIFALTQTDANLEAEFKKFLKGKEVFKFVKDTVENSQNILVIIDDMKPELQEVIDTYTEWNKMVKVLVFKEYGHGINRIMTLTPDFENVVFEDASREKEPKGDTGIISHTEEYHLDGVDPMVKEVYQTIKSKMLEYKPSLRINPQKYYISLVDKRNIAFIVIRKKRIRIVIMLKENTIRNSIKHHAVTSKTPGVQRFYGGECASVTIENAEHLNEVIELMKMAVKT